MRFFLVFAIFLLHASLSNAQCASPLPPGNLTDSTIPPSLSGTPTISGGLVSFNLTWPSYGDNRTVTGVSFVDASGNTCSFTTFQGNLAGSANVNDVSCTDWQSVLFNFSSLKGDPANCFTQTTSGGNIQYAFGVRLSYNDVISDGSTRPTNADFYFVVQTADTVVAATTDTVQIVGGFVFVLSAQQNVNSTLIDLPVYLYLNGACPRNVSVSSVTIMLSGSGSVVEVSPILPQSITGSPGTGTYAGTCLFQFPMVVSRTIDTCKLDGTYTVTFVIDGTSQSVDLHILSNDMCPTVVSDPATGTLTLYSDSGRTSAIPNGASVTYGSIMYAEMIIHTPSDAKLGTVLITQLERCSPGLTGCVILDTTTISLVPAGTTVPAFDISTGNNIFDFVFTIAPSQFLALSGQIVIRVTVQVTLSNSKRRLIALRMQNGDLVNGVSQRVVVDNAAPSATITTNDQGTSASTIGIAVGVAVGLIALFAAVTAAIFLIRRRRRKQQRNPSASEFTDFNRATTRMDPSDVTDVIRERREHEFD